MAIPRWWVTGVRLEQAPGWSVRGLRAATVGVVLPVAVLFLVAGTFSPFLYFQF